MPCVPVNVSTPNFLSIPPFPSSLPQSSPIFLHSGFSLSSRRRRPVFSRSLSYFLSSLFFLPCGFAFELARPASSISAASLGFIDADLAARNTAQRLKHISFCYAFLFPFARGFIAARCLSAFDSRYRSWFDSLHLWRRLFSQTQLAIHVDAGAVSRLNTHIPTRNSSTISLLYTTDIYVFSFVTASSVSISPTAVQL